MKIESNSELLTEETFMRTKEAITLIDVAKAAGVSQATVSRVLNKHPRTNQNTRDKVYNVINQLGYDASSIERKVMKRAIKAQMRLMNLSIVLCPLPEQSNMLSMNFFKDIFNGIMHIINHKDNIKYTIFTWDSEEIKHKAENDKLFGLIQKHDGILILGNPSDNLLNRLAENEIKTVVSTERDNCPFDIVGADNIGGGRLAANYLIDHGIKSIGFLEGPPSIHSWKARKAGVMLETIERLGFDKFSSRKCNSTEIVDVIKTLREWVDSGDFPESLVLPYADSALAVEIVLSEKGIKCPEDLSLITFDNPSVNTFYLKPTCCKIHPETLGKKAALRLLEIINPHNLDDCRHHITVPVTLIEGNSVRKK